MLKNAKRAQARLRRIGGVLAEQAQAAAVSAAENARREAMSMVPVDSGRLRGSLTVRECDGGASVATDCPYASAVELGTSRRAATPFLLPAMEGQREGFAEAARRIGQALGKG